MGCGTKLDVSRNAKAAGPQHGGALRPGARLRRPENELCGLQWGDVDLDRGTTPSYVSSSGSALTVLGTQRTAATPIDIGADTVALLKAHKVAQATLKMRNRVAYTTSGSSLPVSGRPLRHRGFPGLPSQSNTLGSREFKRLSKPRRCDRGHDPRLRHTRATLLLKAGVPPARRPSSPRHAKSRHHLGLYASVSVDGQDAAQQLAVLTPRLTANQKANEPVKRQY